MHCVPELVDPSNELLFGCRFDLPPQKLLELMPEVLNRVEIRAFHGVFDVVLLDELAGTSGGNVSDRCPS